MSSTVLIVDDSLTIRMNLKEAFESGGFATKECATAAEARIVLSQQKIDLIILDVQLPDADGIDLLKEIKENRAIPPIPIIMLSSEADVVDRGRGIMGGADEYIGKPYDASYILAKTQELLRTKHGKHSRRAKPLVLVIDDSLTYREALKTSLVEKGYEVETASTGEDGLKLAVRTRPDALIVDGNLPGIDGATVVRRIKSDIAMRAVPCLLLTASMEKGDESRALDAGADTYVRKDDDAEGIAARLTAIIKLSPDIASPLGGGFLSPKRILAVDDSRTYIEALAEPLREEGYDVIMAFSGEQAIKALAVQNVDCILLDRMMPGMSGQETCGKIKSNPAWRDTPLLMLTAHESREAMLESFGAGADDYVPKSSEFDVLIARVRAQLRRKQFEDETKRVHEELIRKEAEASEARVHKELAETRAMLLKDLERTNKELESFSYSVSHDLRSPLRTIIGFGEILIEEHGKTLNQQGQEHLNRLIHAAKTMGRLIEGLLDLSKLARLDLHIESIDLTSLARGVSNDLCQNDPQRKVQWLLADGVKCQGDPRLLHSVLMNLLSNAWKYSSKKSETRIEFGTSSEKGVLVYYVRDNGAGFDMAYSAKLFGAFQRLHTESEFEGTGIGLASVQRIIHRHGGRIWAESKVGEGATFYFTLSPAV